MLSLCHWSVAVPIVILVGGHICAACYCCCSCLLLLLHVCGCLWLPPFLRSCCAMFVCLPSMSTASRLCRIFFSFFLFFCSCALCPVSCVSCVLSCVLCSNLIAVGTAHMSHSARARGSGSDSDTGSHSDLELTLDSLESIADATDWIFNQNALPGSSYTAATPPCRTFPPLSIGLFNFS